MNCPQCGTPITDNTKFCGQCGFNVADAQSNDTPNFSEQSSDALLAEMFPTITEPQPTALSEKTDKIEQNDTDRLFLDDDEESEEDNSNEFFSNLVSLNENDNMIPDNTGEFFAPSYERKITPVFEEVPDLDLINNQNSSNATNQNFEELESDEDDYSDIVMGDVQTPTYTSQTLENTSSDTSNAEESNQLATETEILTENTVADNLSEAESFSHTEDSNNIANMQEQQNVQTDISSEPVLFIDNSQYPENNIVGEYNVNVNEENQTPFLDKFIPHQNANVNFEIPANMESEHQDTADTIPEQTINQNMDAVPAFQAPDTQPAVVEQQAVVNIPNKEKKKKSKTPLIITLSVIGVLIIGIIASAFLFKDQIVSLFNPQNEQTEITDVNKNDKEYVDNENTDKNITTDNNPNWELISSTIESPIIVGQASKVSKYIDDTKTYSEVHMNLTKIHRGENALTLAKKYEENSNVVFEVPQQGVEYVVVEYDVYIPKELSTNGTTANIPLEVRGLSTNGIVFNNSSYIVSTWCINKGENSTSGQKVTCMDIFQMPIGCTDYYLVFGTNGYTTATYKGQ